MSASLDTSLTAAHAEVKAEIARTDTKTGLLLAFIGAVLAGVWTVAKDAHPPIASLVVGGTGVALLVAAAAVLLRAVRPNLGGDRPVGFPRWARLTADEIRTELGEDKRAQHIAELSRIAVVKYIHLRRAVDLTCAAGVLLIVAAVIAVGGAL
ncbi:integral membrane plasmid transfer protein [Streptomyces sp. GMY02]|uniref:Pycsar system effector family protein n=1 Tax=Streptomyces sp. GMY02 TaxID=1333528 RepID=UPI001C2BF389|nr:Pycsar system effector family protein [Streptomyces sp. GMY02]QXE35900.1 integral membrane plasmid transfer protein [Streptomyces sp. GMY02]